jgi:hypothetical protein
MAHVLGRATPRRRANQASLYDDESEEHGLQNIDSAFPVLRIAGAEPDRFKRGALQRREACLHGDALRAAALAGTARILGVATATRAEGERRR